MLSPHLRHWSTPWGARGSTVRPVHFVIMGCGRVGGLLAAQLDESGHSVAVIDQDPDAFRRLPAEFSGRRITGMGFDRDALLQAGIEEAYALAAVSNGDNSNILTARVARETFGVKHVVARIYDPRRAEVYQRLGTTTPVGSAAQWGTSRKASAPGSPTSRGSARAWSPPSPR